MARRALVALAVAAVVGTTGCGRDGLLDDSEPAVGSELCGPALIKGGCTVGHCTLSAALGAVDVSQPIDLIEEPVPAALAGDATGKVICHLSAPDDIVIRGGLTLTIRLDNPQAKPGALFRVLPDGTAQLVPALSAVAGATVVAGLVDSPGRFGVTDRPEALSGKSLFGLDVSQAADQASLLRNVSSGDIHAAQWDGTHLLVGSGARLLIYNGMPAPGTPPDVVLGQPDLSSSLAGRSSSLFDGSVYGVWSDGTVLYVSTGARVLVWRRIPTRSFTPADLVLGQPDFASGVANANGVSASSLFLPSQIDSDGKRLIVADTLNHRALVWSTLPTAIGQPADSVIGQADFNSRVIGGGATPVYQAWGALLSPTGAFVSSLYYYGLVHVPLPLATNAAPDFTACPAPLAANVRNDYITYPAGIARTGSGGFAVRDQMGNRIAIFRSEPTHASTIDFVLGQPDLDRAVPGPVTASSIAPLSNNGPPGLGGGKTFLVPDGNARLLVYDTPPSYMNEPAARVIGQPGFTTIESGVDYRNVSGATLAWPADVAAAQGLVAVADRGNNRVVLYAAADVASGHATARAVVGQPDATSYVPNLDQVSPSAARLSGPAGVALDGTHLIVADSENHRVLVWNKVPAGSGVPADLVLGQSDFTSRRPNHGRGDVSPLDGFSDAAADGMFYPTGVASDGTRLYVADRQNHRVLVWARFPTKSGQPADAVLGQASFTAVVANRGRGPHAAAPDGFNLPSGLLLAGDSLWVADTENNRAVRWDHLASAPAPAAWLGQPDGSTISNPNALPPGDVNPGIPVARPTTAASVVRPRALALAGGRLAISEGDAHRVHLFDAQTLAPAGQLGQVAPTDSRPNAGGPSAAALNVPAGLASDGTRLYVADSANHRVLAFDATKPPASFATASAVAGQPTAQSNGFNQASTVSGATLAAPHALARSGDALYIADTAHNRVIVTAAPPVAGAPLLAVYGQAHDSDALANRGGPPSADSLHEPRGVYADATRVVLADTGNNRVLVYDRAAGTTARLVLGQADFSSVASNRGGPAGAQTLASPESAWADGDRLWVADSGNHRVLGWSHFPTTSGQPADVVLGQAAMTDRSPNRGQPAPDAGTMAFPLAVRVVAGRLLVADSGNNRVLRFTTPTNGPTADAVLGQPDAANRIAASDPLDLDHLAGPAALTDDGANLYIADRDLHRVMVYRVGSLAGAAAFAIGHPQIELDAPSGLAVDVTPAFTSRLYVSDSATNHMAVITSVSRLR